MILDEALELAGFIWRHPANAGRRRRTLVRAFRWQVYKRVTGRAVDLTVFGGVTFRCYPDSHASSLLLYCNGYPDFHEMAFVERYVRPGDRFIDAGANVGDYSLLAAARVGPSGRVEAFEPDPRAAGRLRENVSANRLAAVHVHEAAVGEFARKVRFLLDRDTENRIATESDGEASSDWRPCVPLDELLDTEAFAMGKMDLEGAEALALRGAARGLSSDNPPVWLLEFNNAMARFGVTPTYLRDWLSSNGYDLATFDAATNQLTFALEPWKEVQNVFAVARRSRDAVLARLQEFSAHRVL